MHADIHNNHIDHVDVVCREADGILFKAMEPDGDDDDDDATYDYAPAAWRISSRSHGARVITYVINDISVASYLLDQPLIKNPNTLVC